MFTGFSSRGWQDRQLGRRTACSRRQSGTRAPGPALMLITSAQASILWAAQGGKDPSPQMVVGVIKATSTSLGKC